MLSTSFIEITRWTVPTSRGPAGISSPMLEGTLISHIGTVFVGFGLAGHRLNEIKNWRRRPRIFLDIGGDVLTCR